MDIKKDKRPHAEVALSGVLPAADIEKEWSKALKKIVESISLPGFRKGHVPEDRVLKEVGEEYVWREAAERALNASLDEMLKKEEVMPIAPLSLSMKPAEKGADVAFEIVAIIAPTATVGDYKAVAEKALKNLPKEDTTKDEAEAKESFIKQVTLLGGDEDPKKIGFESKEALDLFIDEQAKKAVSDKVMQKRRGAVAEALINGAKPDIPHVLIHEEAEAMMRATPHDQKDDAKVTSDMLPHAEKRITLDLVFSEIVKKENLKLEGEEDKKAEDNLAHTVAEQGVPHDRAHLYARETLMREKVWMVLGVKPENS